MASLGAQLVKNLPAVQKTWVWSLGWEDSLEKGKATHSSILAWRIPWGHKELDTTEQLSFSLSILMKLNKIQMVQTNLQVNSLQKQDSTLKKKNFFLIQTFKTWNS